jgi:hypothetical protein
MSFRSLPRLVVAQISVNEFLSPNGAQASILDRMPIKVPIVRPLCTPEGPYNCRARGTSSGIE